MNSLSFELNATDGPARSGTLKTAHGEIKTPVFMPVGTAASVKAMTNEMVESTGASIILGNTYHLMLRPGAERVARLGGLHRLMGWNKPILTDSGGFQVMSLAQRRKLTEQGVVFSSHLDGRKFDLSPERSIEIQHLLGSTITMQLDECLKLPAERDDVERAMELSLRWAQRSKDAYDQRDGYGLFGIQQGGIDQELRVRSAKGLTDIGFDGYAIGGLAVGEPQAVMFETIEASVPHLPQQKPRYLMGVGKPSDLVGAVARGVDMFDCVMPTRSGRNGQAFTRLGPVNLRNARHAEDPRPLDETSSCPAARDYSRAYLHHLVKSGEILACILITWNNLWYYQQLMHDMRDAIGRGSLENFRQKFAAEQAKGDIDPIV